MDTQLPRPMPSDLHNGEIRIIYYISEKHSTDNEIWYKVHRQLTWVPMEKNGIEKRSFHNWYYSETDLQSCECGRELLSSWVDLQERIDPKKTVSCP
jgi:hypothetical protein